MTLEEMKVELKKAYMEYKYATQKYREQARKVEDLKFKLKNQILAAYAAGEIQGKNQTERDAAEMQMFGEQIAQNWEEEKRKDLYGEMQEQARIQLDSIRDLLRIEEVIVQIDSIL